MNATVMCYSKLQARIHLARTNWKPTLWYQPTCLKALMETKRVYHRESIQRNCSLILIIIMENMQVNVTVIYCSKLQHYTFLPPPLEWPG